MLTEEEIETMGPFELWAAVGLLLLCWAAPALVWLASQKMLKFAKNVHLLRHFQRIFRS